MLDQIDRFFKGLFWLTFVAGMVGAGLEILMILFPI